MKFGSLFAGIGGFDLGLERAGMKCEWQVEIDNYATRVLKKHWPDVKRFRDVRECGSHNLASVDLICGGFPCQPHSLAGKRKASSDDRDLWGEFARIICELKPKWVVAENVPGLLSSESGRFFGRVLRDLAAGGYDVEWQCIPASAFGASHQRDRVWIIAYTDSIRQRRLQQVSQSECSSKIWVRRNGKEKQMADSQSIRGCKRMSVFNSWSVGPHSCRQRNTFGESSGIRDAWPPEPNVGRVAYGLPNRVDRLRCLGNAVVPQIVEWIGKLILENEHPPETPDKKI